MESYKFNPYSDKDRLAIIDDELFIFEEEDSQESNIFNENKLFWKIAIVDDEPSVHQATQLALKNIEFEEKKLLFLSAHSAKDAQKIFATNTDIAIVLLDVVMENDRAGLDLVKYIREELNNKIVRIILRTGQPGEAPEESAIIDYDINDYKIKTELTRQKLLVTVISALRSYGDLTTIEQNRQELADLYYTVKIARDNLEELVAIRTQELAEEIEERKKAEEKLKAANQQLEHLAKIDGLTQIANRRSFDAHLQQEWRRMNREQLYLSIILIDVDCFKQYNDYYGHQTGDDCLKQVAIALKNTIKRTGDLVARYGGEEFAIILPNTDAKYALYLAEQMRLSVAQLSLSHASSIVSSSVTISLGIASLIPSKNISPERIIELADRALYRAKQQGRDRIVV
jgi:diguanylate cyclase (GGDEF)-like protein